MSEKPSETAATGLPKRWSAGRKAEIVPDGELMRTRAKQGEMTMRVELLRGSAMTPGPSRPCSASCSSSPEAGPPPARLVLDIDCTDDQVHGRQEGRFFHGCYGHYCFLPLYIFCGAHPLCAVLRPGNTDLALGVVQQLQRVVGQFRRRRPDVQLIVRVDSAYARAKIMAFCNGERDIHCVLGVARNDRLAGRIAPELLAAEIASEGRGGPLRLYTEFAHSTRTSWSRARRLIAKAEHISGKPNPRLLVTSLPETISPRTVYQRIFRTGSARVAQRPPTTAPPRLRRLSVRIKSEHYRTH